LHINILIKDGDKLVIWLESYVG